MITRQWENKLINYYKGYLNNGGVAIMYIIVIMIAMSPFLSLHH